MAFHISLGLSCLNRSPFDDIVNGSKATLRKPKNITIYLSHKTSEVVKSAHRLQVPEDSLLEALSIPVIYILQC